MKIIFAGTPEFACQSLRALVESGFTPAAVLTQPDRPAGRGKRLTASSVKSYAQERQIPVWQPATLRDASIVADIGKLDPDVIIVAAYGLILSQAVLDLPGHGCINVHASLLPRWRGAAPIQAAILAGDPHTGISLMQMEAGLDSGPVYAREQIAIGDSQTAGQLHDRLATLGGDTLVRHLPQIVNGELQPAVQDESAVTYAGKIRTDDATLDWSVCAVQLQRMVRAYNPVPGAWFRLNDERIKCWSATLAGDQSGPPGTVLSAGKLGIDVYCGRGVLRMLELQRPGRKRVNAAEFAAQMSPIGTRLR